MSPSDRSQAVDRLLDRLPVPVVVASPVTGKVLWVNQHLVKMARGTHAGQFIGTSLFDYIEPRQMARALKDLAAVVAGKSPEPVIYYLKDLAGQSAAVHIASIPIMHTGQPAMLSLVTDVSDRERLIRELAESEHRYRLLMDNTPSGLLVTVHREIVFANSSITRALGIESPEGVLGRDVYEFIASEHHTAFRGARRRAIESGDPQSPVEVTLVGVDGTCLQTTAATVRIRWDGLVATQTLMHDLPARMQPKSDKGADSDG